MRNHSYFEEMAALAARGQVSGPDLEEFLEHSEFCLHCRKTFLADVEMQDALALVSSEPGVFHRLHSIPEGAKDRFVANAVANGARFSVDSLAATKNLGMWFTYRNLGALTAILLVLAGVGLKRFYQVKPTHFASTQVVSQKSPTINATERTDQLAREVRELSDLLKAREAEIARLRSERATAAQTIGDLESRVQDEKAAGQSWQSTWDSHLAMEQNLVEQKDQRLTSALADLESARQKNSNNVTELAALEIKVNELTNQLKMQQAVTDREHELLSANRDIRDLMGARNLHIVDVIDADNTGKKTKAFGRVFYTEGKSLIFYAYDLSESKLKDASYAFQVWGKKPSGSVQNLGILFQDDQHLRRWVLKVNDPVVLQSINSVFVTVGPTQNAKPQGQKLLYAFLEIAANHP